MLVVRVLPAKGVTHQDFKITSVGGLKKLGNIDLRKEEEETVRLLILLNSLLQIPSSFELPRILDGKKWSGRCTVHSSYTILWWSLVS